MPMDCVMWVVGLPWVYGLKGDEGFYVKVMRSAGHLDHRDHPSLMDGGANICITGIFESAGGRGDYTTPSDIDRNNIGFLFSG